MWTLISIAPDFSLKLQQNAKRRLQMQQFREAELAAARLVVSQIRNDQIFWLDAKSEPSDTEVLFLKHLDELRLALKKDFRIALEAVECHYAFYEPGHFYQKHRDTTAKDNKRIFSFVLYLNENWKSEHGGHLVGYQGDGVLFEIAPEMGQMILFRSDLEHEVKPTLRERLSLTGWFRC